MVISEFTAPRWSNDGTRILVGLKAQEAEPPASDRAAGQRRRVALEGSGPAVACRSSASIRIAAPRTRPCVDLAAGAVRQIANDDMRAVTATDDLQLGHRPRGHAVPRTDPVGRQQGGHVSRESRDRTSARSSRPALAHDGHLARRQVVPVSQKGHVYSYDMATGKKTAIDGGKSFVDAEDDHDYEKPVYGVAGFIVRRQVGAALRPLRRVDRCRSRAASP